MHALKLEKPSVRNRSFPTEKATVLLVEGRYGNKDTSFASALGRRYTLVLVHSGKQAIDEVGEQKPDIIVLDSASMRTSGLRICKTLQDTFPDLPIIQIQKAPKAPKAKAPKSTADVVLKLPFTPRKLINRIERFLATKEGETLEVGPLKLNLKSKVLLTNKGEFRLTPKVATLLEAFMRHPNEVLERRYLMVQVWETDYLGDTRTLDVHIRWIREAVETNPSKPAYIRTVRGVGYLFDSDPKSS